MSTMQITFNGPPPSSEQGPGSGTWLKELSDALTKRPGEWAQVEFGEAPNARRKRAYFVKVAKSKGLPVEAVTRGSVMYARATGA